MNLRYEDHKPNLGYEEITSLLHYLSNISFSKICTAQILFKGAEGYHQCEMYYGMVKLLPIMLAKGMSKPISVS